VNQDIENGTTVKDGKPPVTLLSEHRVGGMFDNLSRTIVGPSVDPLVWYISERQWPLINHEPKESRILCFGAEGAGKSHTLCQYTILSVLKSIGHKGQAGATAPTGGRLKTLLDVMRTVVPIDTPHDRRKGSWGTFYGFNGIGEVRFITGLTLVMRATHKASSALGSPLQGLNFMWCVSDEIQDSIEEDNGARDADIEARLRAAPGGESKRFCTATAKDSSFFRTWRAEKDKSPDWTIERMPYYSNWSVWPKHWQTMKTNLSDREFKRRCLAMDLPPSNATYPAWDRQRNLRALPDLGSKDVTSHVLKQFGANFEMLIGHDPGTVQDASIFLKAYKFRGEPEIKWVVVDEITTTGSTELHAKSVLDTLRNKWRINFVGQREPKALVRCDPFGDSANKTDRSVYLQFKLFGLDMRSSAYTSKGKGSGIISKDARIEVVNRLLCNAAGQSRLMVLADEHGRPCAPKLVEAFEQSERDLTGRAEMEKKGTTRDRSHWPAALGYALWTVERLRAVQSTQKRILL
jgi:hypothetical protein